MSCESKVMRKSSYHKTYRFLVDQCIKRDMEVLGLSFSDQTFDLQTVRDMYEFSIYVGLAVRTYVQAYVQMCVHT